MNKSEARGVLIGARFSPPEAKRVIEAVKRAVELAKAAGALGAPAELPYVMGFDGVGRTPDGRRVYFEAPVSPHGSWAQQTLAREMQVST